MPTLTRVVTNNTVLASDINGIMAIVSRASGESETGKYYLRGWSNAATDALASYTGSLTRGTTPTGVVIDEADQAHGGGNNSNAASTANVTANGFLALCTSSGASVTVQVAGNYTINF